MGGLHRFVRRQLWWWAILFAAALGIGRLGGSLDLGWHVVQVVVSVFGGVIFIGLIVAGWLDWRAGLAARPWGLRTAALYALGVTIVVALAAVVIAGVVFVAFG